jgi:hypothetical protein
VWGFYRQTREADKRYLVSSPVRYQPAVENNLNGMLGQHLARGLYASNDTNEADRIRMLDGTWSTYYLATNTDDTVYWWNPSSGTTADVQIVDGTGMWIERSSNAASTTNAVFMGITRTEDEVTDINFTADSWRIFSWALPIPKQHVNAGAATETNQLGLALIGRGGTSLNPSFPEKHGDQIWVWEDNTWKHRYWLIDNDEIDAESMKWNHRWWDPNTGDFADFQLEAGKAYYYKHVTNQWGGVNFTWSPEN